MIPVSVIDVKIKEFEEIAKIPKLSYERQYIIASVVIPMLEELKKEAIPSLEQKINDRIAYLEEAGNFDPSLTLIIDGVNWSKELIESRIDELRKLLE